MAKDYRCLCGFLHVKTGTRIISIFDIVFGILIALFSTHFLTNDRKYDAARYVQAAIFFITVIWLLCIILLMVALCKEKASLMMPHFVGKIIGIVLFAVDSGVLIINGVRLYNGIILALMSLFLLFLLMLEGFLLTVEWRCYKYLSAVQRHPTVTPTDKVEEDRCLCGLVNIKTGTWIVAILRIIFTVLYAVLYSIKFLTHDRKDGGTRYAEIGSFGLAVIGLLCIILLMVALCKNKASLMMPHLVWTIIAYTILGLTSGTMIRINFMMIGRNIMIKLIANSIFVGSLFAVTIILSCPLLLFLLVVEWRCYEYLRMRAVGYP